MKSVYKSYIILWLFITLMILLLMYFLPEALVYRRFFTSNAYVPAERDLGGCLFVGVLGVIFLGAFCKTVIETDDGFEVHYMYGLQKKWFGKDFLIFDFIEQHLPDVSHGGRWDNTHLKLWDGSKKTFIYPGATRNFDKLKNRLYELANEHQAKKSKRKDLTQSRRGAEGEDMKPDLKIVENFLAQSHRLFHVLKEEVDWDTRMKARKTASFGVSYDYSGIEYPQTEMHEELVPVCDLLEKELGFRPNNCLLNFYEDGNSSLGYHSDSSEELKEGTGVAIISLGAERTINYKNKTDREVIVPYKLKSGTLLFMDKQVQEEWLHSIPKEEGIGARISLTFRNIIK